MALLHSTTKLWRRFFLKGASIFILSILAREMVSQSIATTNIGANQATLQLTSTSDGTGFFTLLSGAGATCGTATQTAAGQNNAGSAVLHGALALAANTAGNYTVRNLQKSSGYTACFTPNGTTTPISSSFTTLAGASITTPVWSLVGGSAISAGSASYERIAFAPDGTLYLAYRDSANSSKAMVVKFDGSAWSTVGNANFSVGSAGYMGLTFSPDGTPYVVYADSGNGTKATVMKLVENAWTAVGSGTISTGIGNYPAIAFSPDGSPYVVFTDSSNGSKATVMKFDGTQWSGVGGAAVSEGTAAYTSIAFSQDGSPYVAYSDGNISNKATVKRFDGAQWVTVGTAGISSGAAWYTTVRFAPDGTPYVAFEDAANTYAATVMKYSGIQWSAIGSAGLTPGRADYLMLTFAPDNQPVIAFEDSTYSSKASAMKYDGTSWAYLGTGGFSSGTIYYTWIEYSPTGVPYVTFYDSGYSGKAIVMVLQQATAPSVSTGSATSITSSTATLNGTANDNGFTSTVGFEYGTTTSYGSTVVPTNGSNVAAGTGSTSFSAGLTGLTLNTLYHYRAVATGNSKTVYGADISFTTDKLTPTVTTWPTASTLYYGQFLTSSALTGGAASVPGTFAWTASYTLPLVGTNSYSVTFTPTDTATYNTVSNTVSITVTKATPTITAWPTASGIYAGQTLASSTLTGGAASTSGTFSWTDSATVATTTGNYGVRFTPDYPANYEIVTGNVNVQVTQSTPAITLSSSINPLLIQNATVLTCVVSSNIISPSGTVTFMDGSSVLGSQSLTRGIGSLSLSSLAVGTHTLTAVYSGDTNLNAVTSAAITQIVTDMTLNIASGSNTSQTISAGGTATYSLALTPSGSSTFAADIQLSVSGLPSGSSYTITPANIAAGASATNVTLAITVPNKTAMLRMPSALAPVSWGLLLLPLPLAAFSKRKSSRLMKLLVLFLLTGGIAGFTGCGNSSPSTSSTQQNYAVTFTATSGVLQRSTPLTLTVQ